MPVNLLVLPELALLLVFTMLAVGASAGAPGSGAPVGASPDVSDNSASASNADVGTPSDGASSGSASRVGAPGVRQRNRNGLKSVPSASFPPKAKPADTEGNATDAQENIAGLQKRFLKEFDKLVFIFDIASIIYLIMYDFLFRPLEHKGFLQSIFVEDKNSSLCIDNLIKKSFSQFNDD